MSEIKVMSNDEIRDFCIKKDLKIFELKQELQQKENIIKEVREYIYNKEINTLHFNSKDFLDTSIATELLEILDKENK